MHTLGLPSILTSYPQAPSSSKSPQDPCLYQGLVQANSQVRQSPLPVANIIGTIIVLNVFRSCYLNRWFCKFGYISVSTIDLFPPHPPDRHYLGSNCWPGQVKAPKCFSPFSTFVPPNMVVLSVVSLAIFAPKRVFPRKDHEDPPPLKSDKTIYSRGYR